MDSDSRLSKKRRLESPVAPPITGLQVPWDGVEVDVDSLSFVDWESTNAASDLGDRLVRPEDFRGSTDSTAPFWCFGMVVSPKA